MEVLASVVGAVVSSTVTKLLIVIGKESGDLKLDAESIQRELSFIYATVRDQPPDSTKSSNIRKEWMVQLRGLADDIEDCIDSFHIGKKTSNSKRQFARQVAQLKDRSKEIRKEFATIGDRTTTSSEEVPPPAAAYRHMRDAEAELVGLMQSQSEEGKLKVIAIAGLGGSGMTLLAKQVYESDVGLQFSRRAWVSAAGKNAEAIISEVLKKVEIQNNGASTSSQVEDNGKSAVQEDISKDDAVLIQSCLYNKRYLIVIDDVKKEDLKELVSVFSWADGVEGCRILATTTIQLPGVPTRCTCGDRLPLALDSTTHFLKIGELTDSRFEQDCLELGAKLKAVVVSDYESLCNLLLQDLLLYFSMFPSDHPVRRNPLMRRWSAEGLVFANPEDLIDQQDAGAADNLTTLIECNIIQPVVVSNNGKVKTCQPPLMMLDYIANKSVLKHFVTLFCGQTQTNEVQFVRRLSLHPGSGRKKGMKNLPDDLSRLRTLAVFPTATKVCSYKDELRFAKYNLLRVLDLKECADLKQKDLKGVCGLFLLRYLSLGNAIGKVPKKIKKLQQLETLEMRRIEAVEVHPDVFKLAKLKHLLGKFQFLDGTTDGTLLEDGDQLVMETLSGFVTDKSQRFPRLMLHHMGQLKKVKIWCHPSTDQANLAHFSDAITAFVNNGNRTVISDDDRSLSIDFAECTTDCSVALLGSLQTPGRLNSLKLHGDILQHCLHNKFVTKLRSVQELCLSSTNLSGDAILACSSNLRVLKYLKLVEHNLGPLNIKQGHFPGLERICLVGLQVITIQSGALYRLVSLHMLCEALLAIPGTPGVEIKHMAGLKEVGLHPRVNDEKRNIWQAAASGHPNRPEVLFIQGP